MSSLAGLTEEEGFIRIVSLISTVVARRHSELLTEDLGKVGLAGKAAMRGNVNDAHIASLQKRLGVVDAALEHILVRRDPHRRAEHFQKVAAAVARFRCERRQTDL